MNNYVVEVRKRNQNLLIVEGKHEKEKLFRLLFHCFPEMRILMDDIWIYGTNIYMLYNDIVKEYGEQWIKDDVDLPFVVSKKQELQLLRYKEDFTNIFLVFDYERHDPYFSEDKIVQMQSYFIDSADMGKLYINYPMIESYQHLCSLPDKSYLDKKISVSLQLGRKYKSLVREDSIIEDFVEFPIKINNLLKEHFQILNTKTRLECCERIFSINSDDNLLGQIQDILVASNINKYLIDTAKYHIKDKVKRMNYAASGQTYWEYMRDVFKKIIIHNICKAEKIQYNNDIIESEKYVEYFERINLKKILDIQNVASGKDEISIIWILCTCVFLVPEYNLSLVFNK